MAIKRIFRYSLFLTGLLLVALGFIGAVIPLLPTVPFLILALWCFACSSKRFHDWLYHHRLFGPQLQLWEQYQVIPLKAKIIAITSMLLSLGYLICFSPAQWWLVAFAAIVMTSGACYILSKPSKVPCISSSKY